MLANVTQGEMALLEYLFKHSGGCGERIALDPKAVIQRLRISMTQFDEATTSLRTLGLAGARDFRPNANDVPSSKCSAIWITKKGGDYLRSLRAKAGPEHAQVKECRHL